MKSIENKILISFAVVTLTFLAMTISTFVLVDQTTELSRRIQYTLVPSIEANLRMTNAINSSSSSLQSWINSNDKRFIRQRLALWSLVEKNHKQLVNHSAHWNNDEHVNKLKSINEEVLALKYKQDYAEKMVLTKSNLKVYEYVASEIIPLRDSIVSTLRFIYDPQRWEVERTFLKEENLEENMKNISLLFLILSIAGGTTLGLILWRAVILPLNSTVKIAEKISNGEYKLETQFYSGDEKLDVALMKMTSELYQKNMENNAQRERLEIYTKRLEASNEELSQFSYRTSHDLKAPLITVKGLALAIQEDIAGGDYVEVEKNSKKIVNHVKKLENLIVDIFTLAKAELEIKTNEPVIIKEIVRDITTRLNETYVDHKVEIKLDLSDKITLIASKVRLCQVLENLISNAIKYKDTDKVSQTIIVSSLDNAERRLIIIKDNGLGIPIEFQNNVFGMFQRFHPQIAHGSGLGLYIVKKHIEKMGAKINFTSSCDGTVFVLDFPQHAKEA